MILGLTGKHFRKFHLFIILGLTGKHLRKWYLFTSRVSLWLGFGVRVLRTLTPNLINPIFELTLTLTLTLTLNQNLTLNLTLTLNLP